MSEKPKRSYEWKKDSQSKDERLHISKNELRLAAFALILSIGLNIELIFDNKPSQMLFDKINGNKTEESIPIPELLGSEIITIKDTTLESEATKAAKELAINSHVDLEDIDYEAIQYQARVAQELNSPDDKSYPDDKYIISLSKNISGIYETDIKPIEKQQTN